MYIFVITTILSVTYKFRFTDTHTHALVKLYFHCHTTLHTFQDLLEHTSVHILMLFVKCFQVYHQHCVTKPPKHYYLVHLHNSGLSLSFKALPVFHISLNCVQNFFHCKKGDVAVHEYANSTSAHDTVLEHRFSPTQTSFTS